LHSCIVDQFDRSAERRSIVKSDPTLPEITRLGDGASSSTIDMSSKKYTGLTVP